MKICFLSVIVCCTWLTASAAEDLERIGLSQPDLIAAEWDEAASMESYLLALTQEQLDLLVFGSCPKHYTD